MKNKGLKIMGSIVALILILFLGLVFTVNGIVKSGIEEMGSELLQTPVSVQDVDISVINGSGKIQGFKVQNPENYSDEPALDIQEISVKLNLVSLFTNQIVVDEIFVKSPNLFFEQKGIGANLKLLNDNMAAYTESDSEKTMIINYLLIENGQVKVSTTIERERTVEASIQTIELEGIGQDGNNTVKQSIRQVLEPLLQQTIREALKSGVTEQIENKVRDILDQ